MSDQQPTEPYKPGISAKKATTQAALSYLAMAASALTVVVTSPELSARVIAAVAAYPKVSAWTLGLFGAVRFGLAFWRDYQKHKDQAAALEAEHGLTGK
jgi:hypothetical protein